MFCDNMSLKGQLNMDSWPGPGFQMRRLWRLWRHDYDVIESLRHRWRHQSTHRRHFPSGH